MSAPISSDAAEALFLEHGDFAAAARVRYTGPADTPPLRRLWQYWRQQRIATTTQLAEHIRDIWTMEAAPAKGVTRREMYATFRVISEVSDAPLPRRSVQLYRGATPRGARGWSWTGDRDVADRFAERPGGRVYTALVPPRAILARLRNLRSEDEYIVDLWQWRDVTVKRALTEAAQ